MHPDDFKIVTHAATSTLLSFSSSTTTSAALLHIATAAVTSLATQIATSTTAFPAGTSSKPSPDDEENGECKLLGPFALLVQGALGGLALLSLVFKRWRERPQRPVKVWAFDASKQVFGSVLLHIANLAMSMFSSGQFEGIANVATDKISTQTATVFQPNPCSFYLLNLAIDTTLGIPILVLLLKIIHVGASHTPLASPPESIKSGHYGIPPKWTWWIKQSMLYFIGLLLMKLCVFFIFQLCPWIVQAGDWALRWTEGNEGLQIAFVMLIFPLIMNALQYYIIDTFIKGKAKEGEEENTEAGGHDDEQGGLLANEHTSHGDSIDEDEVYKSGAARNVGKDDRIREIVLEEPEHGESSTPNSGGEDEAVKNPPRI